MRGSWTRRAFLARTGGAAAGVLALGAGACSSDDGDDDTASRDDDEVPRAVMPPTSDDGVPTAAAMFGWIQQIFDQGIRRVGYPADEWTEQFVAEQFRAFGLEDVRLEPVRATRWEPLNWSLEATPEGGDARTLECFPLPYAAPTEEVELELVAYDPDRPELVEGKASLWEEAVIRPPADVFLHAGSAPADSTGRVHDPDGTLGNEHVLPFGPQFLEVMEPSMEAGAAAFVGYVQGYPKESCTLYNPYDAIERPIPGVYVKESDGLWLREQLAQGPVRIRLVVETATEEVETHNVVGELPGPDDDVVMVGSHHDGPWKSAVEDASGVALVLAQAAYWSAVPVEDRPHRMVFLLQAAHMAGWKGHLSYIETHREELDRVVLQMHLEHAAREFVADEQGDLVPNGLPAPRWWFTSRIPRLEAAVYDALVAHDLRRSLLVAPDANGDQPPTDGGFFHNEGVPIAQFLAAPYYLGVEDDTLDKVDREGLEPLTRAVAQILESTRGVSTAEMRQGAV